MVSGASSLHHWSSSRAQIARWVNVVKHLDAFLAAIEHCRPSRYLTMAASSRVTMPGCEKAPPVDSGEAFVVMVT